MFLLKKNKKISATKNSNLALLATTVTLIFWSSSFIGISYGLKYYQPGSLALLRLSIASMAIIPIFLLKYNQKPLNTLKKSSKKTFLILIISGIIGLGLYNLSLNAAEKYITASTASFIISQTPIVTTILAVLYLKERIFLQGMIGIAISFLGILIIYLSDKGGGSETWGLIFSALATVCAAVYFILIKYLSKYYKAIYITTASILSSCAFLFVFFNNEIISQVIESPIKVTLAVLYLGFFSTAIAYGTWSYAITKINIAKLACSLYAIPLLTMLFSILFFNESISIYKFIGGFTAIFGLIILSKSRNKDNLHKSV